jgi:hypothetical protein
VSVGLCSLFLMVFAVHVFKSNSWILTVLLFFMGLVVLTAGMERVVIHKERTVLVFATMIIDLLILVFVIGKSLIRKKGLICRRMVDTL